MEFHSKKEGKATVVKLTGRLDAITTAEYETRVKKLIDEGESAMVIDFDELTYISSAGLRGLLSTAKQIKAKNGQVCFANVKGAVKEVFAISGFQSIFTMHDSLPTALAALA